MRVLVQALGAVLLAAASVSPVASAASDAAVVELRSLVELRADMVRVGDLGRHTMGPVLAEQAVFPAPAPGHERRISRETLRRLLVQAGVSPMPRLTGASSVLLRRPGQELGPAAMTARILQLLEAQALPPFAIGQRFTIEGVRGLRLPEGAVRVELAGSPPRVGRGSVALRVIDSNGSERRHYARVGRDLRTVVLRTLTATSRGTELAAAAVRADTLWVEDALHWDHLCRAADGPGPGWTLVRSVPGDHVLRTQDLRPTPVVRRGELTDWVVERNGIIITLSVRARRDGARGDWILVENPLDGKLRRVYVLGPGRVAEHPPRRRLPIKEAGAAVAARTLGERP